MNIEIHAVKPNIFTQKSTPTKWPPPTKQMQNRKQWCDNEDDDDHDDDRDDARDPNDVALC